MTLVNASLRTRQSAAALLLGGILAAAIYAAGSGRLERADFVFKNGTEVQSLDPATVTGVPEGRVIRMIYEGLCITHPETLDPIPGVAESWEISPDGKTYTFHLRDNARWSNGDPVTARDFEWSLRRMLHPMTAAEYAYQLWYIKGARSYTHMPEDLFYAATLNHSVWIEELEEGSTTETARVRMGLTGFQLEEVDPSFTTGLRDESESALSVGSIVEVGGGFVDFSNPSGVQHHYHSPITGTVVALNQELPQTGAALSLDPYVAGWMIELECPRAELERALAAGDILPGPDFRSTWIEGENRLAIHASDELTLEIQLNNPTAFFLNLMAFYPTFPVHRPSLEAASARGDEGSWLEPDNLVTNGPYTVEFRRVNDRIRCRKSPNYWDADEVAFETVDVLAVEHTVTGLNLYLTGECDWLETTPPSLIPRLVAREDFDPAPYMGTYFYRVNITRPPFDDVRVRRALALSIDREAICTNITKAGEVPAFSYVPPGMPGYSGVEMDRPTDPDPERARAQRLEEAKRLIAEAGYGPGGEKLRSIQVHYNTSETHKDIAEVLADTWKRELGLRVEANQEEWKVYLDTQSTVNFDISRSAWIGDYLDANTFLDMFVTDGENNRTGWGDPRYDELIAAASSEPDKARRLAHLQAAERILMEELPIIPIYFYVTKNMVNPRLGGFHENLLDEHYPKFWYWMDDAELEAKRATRTDEWTKVEAQGPSGGFYSPAAERRRSESGK
ncbi:MAG: ABC transporter substrate-binding protein [Planctomycetota bacterium]|nr:ABC transporter substrate-binding protein [Planctomycetota bacterium]